MSPDFPVIEFAQVVRNAQPGRTCAADVTVFDSVGFALEDYTALRFLHELLPHYPQWRQRVDLVSDLENPKDLFGGTLGSRVKARMRRAA
jgi:ornithine cyclodeaminase